MIKLIGACLVLLCSSVFVLFSKSKVSPNCHHQAEGLIKERKDSAGIFLVIETKDNQLFYPQITDEKVTLVSGSRVKICYDIIEELPNKVLLVNINQATYLP